MIRIVALRMQLSDFVSTVVPLTLIVALLVALVLYYARKEEKGTRELRKLENERKKKKEMATQELKKLRDLLDKGSITADTYLRLRELIVNPPTP